MEQVCVVLYCTTNLIPESLKKNFNLDLKLSTDCNNYPTFNKYFNLRLVYLFHWSD